MFYPAYLDWLYASCPDLASARYRVQNERLVRDAFSAIHIIAPHLSHAGYDSRVFVANCQAAQIQWARERDLAFSASDWMKEIVKYQIDRFNPDIIYFSEPGTFDSRFVRTLKNRPRLILGWRAASIPEGTDWSEFDVILSSLTALRDIALVLGAHATEHFSPGFPEWIAETTQNISSTVDVVFVGQYTRKGHQRRNVYLRKIAEAAKAPQKGFTCNFHLSGAIDTIPMEIEPFLRSPAYGMSMHQALRKGRIAFDARGDIEIKKKGHNTVIDLAQQESANMRIFEATGTGVFLLTEYFKNLESYFEIGREIETFTGKQELIGKIRYYIQNPEEREEIARRGQQRCLRDHSMGKRVSQFDTIIRSQLGLSEKEWTEESQLTG